MISNYYTLRFLATVLDNVLRGSEIEEIFCQAKNELLISFRADGERRCLTVSCEPSMNYAFLRSQINRAKKNSVDVFRILWGKTIQEVSIQPADRELVIHCSGDVRLLIRMFGSKANVLLIDDQYAVMDSFLNAKELRGTLLSDGGEARSQRKWTRADFQAQLRSIGTILLPAALKKLLPLFNTTLIREACHRSGVNEHKVVADLNEEGIEKLFASC